MKKQELLEKIAPCSLMCHTCSAYSQGIICESSKQLMQYLEGIHEFYLKHSPEEAKRFAIFQSELDKYSKGICSGCRNREHHSCSIGGCFILECTGLHNVDFCGECTEFPCERTKEIFEDEVYMQWLKGNTEIKSDGIQAFWRKYSERPHYLAYKER